MARVSSLALLLLATAPARGESRAVRESENVAALGPRVEIRVLGDDSALAQVQAAAQELFSRLEVRLSVLADSDATPPETEPPLVLAYVDLRVPTAPRVDVDDGRTRQALMRRSLSDVSSMEVGVEAVLHVVLASVESLLQLRSTRAAAPAPPPRRTPRPPDQPRRGTGVDLGALLRLTSFGGARLTPGAGASLELRTDAGPVQAELGVWGALHTTSQLDFNEGHADLRPYAMRLMPGVNAHLSRSLVGSAGLGVGADYFVLDARTSPTGGQGRDHAVIDPLLSSQLGLRFPLTGPWFLSVLGTLDVDLAPGRFVVDRGANREVLLALPRWRGGFMLMASLSPTPIRRFDAHGELR